MNKAINSFDMELVDECTSEEVYELLDHILALHHSTFMDQYCRTRISVDTAAEVAFASPAVCDDYFEAHTMEPELIVNHLSIKPLAHYLTFTEPEKATILLDELLYYRTQSGRI